MKTSVIIATKNSALTINETLESLMPYYKQGFIFEILVVDGCSTDRTLDILKKFPIKLYISKKVGYASSREIGWKNSRGELLIFLDSDAYLRDNFFPNIFEFFQDEKIGLVGCWAKAVVTNDLTKTISEEWTFLSSLVKSSRSPIIRFYSWLQGANPRVTPGGPCHIVRRVCLQSVGGFPEYAHAEDIALAERILQLGWENKWWLQSPVYHHPRSSLKSLLSQSNRNGKLFAVWQLAVKKQTRKELLKDFHSVLSIISRLSSPLVGIYLSVNFRNFRHLFTYSLSRYAWLVGYISTFIGPLPMEK